MGYWLSSTLLTYILIYSLSRKKILVDIYEKFSDYIEEHYKNFVSKKVPFAKKVIDSIDSTNVLDLEQKIKKLYEEIKRWNKK